jgi:hypothetical protein
MAPGTQRLGRFYEQGEKHGMMRRWSLKAVCALLNFSAFPAQSHFIRVITAFSLSVTACC